MAPQTARPRSPELGGKRDARAQYKCRHPAERSLSPPSADCAQSAFQSDPDGCAPDHFQLNSPPGAERLSANTGTVVAVPAELALGSPIAVSSPSATGGDLPCLLSSNNSTKRLSSQHQKTARALVWNVAHFAEKFGLPFLGFLTLTFRDDVQSSRAAQRRFNSLATHVLRPRYGDYIRVLERQKSGRIHYHLLINTKCDIRSNVDFAAFAQGDYRTASQHLRAEWRFWRETAPAYAFGRTELMPVRSTHEGISRYVGKYIGKSVQTRRKSDRNVRLVDYTRGARLANTRFAGVGTWAREWRQRVAEFALMQECGSMEGLTAKFGPAWAWNCRDAIYGMLQTIDVEKYTNEDKHAGEDVRADVAALVGVR